MPKRLTKKQTKNRITAHYDRFVADGLTVGAACRLAQEMIQEDPRDGFFRQLRNDMSTHLSGANLRVKFDPAKHTHGFANL